MTRKATKTAKKVPPNSEELKESYDIFATAVENRGGYLEARS